MKKHSIVVVGSGPVALSAALLLENYGLDVGIILDQNKIDTNSNSTGPARLFAIADKSREILNTLNLGGIENNSQTINHIRIVDDNSLAKVDFSPADIGLENFGYMIDEKVLINILHSKLIDSKVKVYQSNGDLILDESEFFTTISLDDLQIKTQLVIAADGKHSGLRKQLGVESEIYDYNQTAIVIDIRHSSWPHYGVAVEKFTPNGPFAILPKHEENGTTSSLVWVEKGIIKNLNAFSKEALKDLIMRKLDDYLGDIELISEPLLYNLKLIKSKVRFKGRVVFAGDSAQGIHPIAGQGFNLGLRDVTGLVDLVNEATELGLDYKDLLDKYSKSRDLDVSSMILATTGINALFANDLLLVKGVRRLGLNIFDKIGFLKRITMRKAAGST